MKADMQKLQWYPIIQVYKKGKYDITKKLYKRFEKNRIKFMKIQSDLFYLKEAQDNAKAI